MYSSSDEYSDESDDSSSTMGSNSDYDEKFKFKFPPPPRLTKSADISHISSLSDSSNSDGFLVCTKRSKRKKLPPIGIFWDIENCQVPKFKSASAIVQRFRTFFLQYYREAEFQVVCDVKKEHPQVIQELHDSQVNLIHVSAISKNAADEKLRQSLRRFAEVHRSPCAIVLISGDMNFAGDLSDLRYRKKVRVILVHNANAADALILCANDHYSYQDLLEDLPHHKKMKVLPNDVAVLEINNLPLNCNFGRIKLRLKLLVDNCGGRVQEIHRDGRATISFTTMDFALRAQKRINGEDVYGSKIIATLKNNSEKKSMNESISPLSVPANSIAQNDNSRCNNSFKSGDNSFMKKNSGNNFFRPIESIQNPNGMGVSVLQPAFDTQKMHGDSSNNSKAVIPTDKDNNIPLVLSNLDPMVGVDQLKRAVIDALRENVVIRELKMIHIDTAIYAYLEVSSQDEAQFVIHRLHREKFGLRRLIVSQAKDNSSTLDTGRLKAILIAILQDGSMSHKKFTQLIKSKHGISLSQMQSFQDIYRITDDMNGRNISLIPNSNVPITPCIYDIVSTECALHRPRSPDAYGWLEEDYIEELPYITFPLKFFADQLHYMLDIHMGIMPLMNFQVCYRRIFNTELPLNDEGVALEHLITCLPNAVIKWDGPNKSVKTIKREYKTSERKSKVFHDGILPQIAPALNLFSSEIVELLGKMEKSQLPLSDFRVAYYDHFRRRYNDENYANLSIMKLCESLPQIIQILGYGERSILTLTHSEQKKRFSSDLMKILTYLLGNQMSMLELPSAYEKIMKKSFSPVNYGMCTLEDLLKEVNDNLIVVNKSGDETIIEMKKKKQTSQQIDKTKEFAVKVVELFKYAPHFTIPLKQFDSDLHRHFGQQFNVKECGFEDLNELFMTIPDSLKIIELPDGETIARLALPKMFDFLGTQISSIMKNLNVSAIFLAEFPNIYLKENGFSFEPGIYECENIEQVLSNISEHVQLLHTVSGSYISLSDQDSAQIMKIRAWSLLLDPPYCKEIVCFKDEYEKKYKCQLNMESLNELKFVFSISRSNSTNYILLTRLYILAAQFYHILYNNGGHIYYNDLEMCLHACYGNSIELEDYDIFSPIDLLKYFGFFVFLSENAQNPLITLNKKLSDHQIPIPSTLEDGEARSIEKPEEMPNFETKFRNSPLLREMDLKDLISSDLSFFSVGNNSMCDQFTAPDAAELPIPDKLIPKSATGSFFKF